MSTTPCRCNSGIESPTICPKCGGAIRPHRPTGSGDQLRREAVVRDLEAANPQRTNEDAYYDGDELVAQYPYYESLLD